MILGGTFVFRVFDSWLPNNFILKFSIHLQASKIQDFYSNPILSSHKQGQREEHVGEGVHTNYLNLNLKYDSENKFIIKSQLFYMTAIYLYDAISSG